MLLVIKTETTITHYNDCGYSVIWRNEQLQLLAACILIDD